MLDMIEKGDWVYSFELKAGYHHVDIRESCQTYLGFSWVLGGRQQYCVFTVWPFGALHLPVACLLSCFVLWLGIGGRKEGG